jgi:hypothetical protein
MNMVLVIKRFFRSLYLVLFSTKANVEKTALFVPNTMHYSYRPITCDFDINQPKSSQNGSKVPLGPHILAQLDEIYRLVHDLTEFG